MHTSTRKLIPAFRFFMANAGYCTPPGKAVCALSLARAERWFNRTSFEFIQEPEMDVDLSWMSDEERKQEHEVIAVRIVKPCKEHGVDCRHAETLASLGNVVDADNAYMRVIRAELASEIMPKGAR